MRRDTTVDAEVLSGRPLELKVLREVTFAEFERWMLDGVSAGQRVASYFGIPSGEHATLYGVLVEDANNLVLAAKTRVEGTTFPSLAPRLAQVHLFEREIAEQCGIRPEGHPWFKPVRYHASWAPPRDAWGRPASQAPLVGVTDFYRVEGDEVHEVAVGPVHAGVIEPGHFRFQCHGEEVFHLEISLGYQHRGVERALRQGSPGKRTIHYMETLAGDTSVGHATAYCEILESLAGCRVPPRAQVLRGVALELERLANHTGDLGALANDVGYLPTASYCGRLRGDYLNMTGLICGSRFGRGLVRPGGAAFDLDDARVENLLKRLAAAEKDTANAVNLLWDSSSVMSRFEGIGKFPLEVARDLGVVGLAARASGLNRDVRHDHPSGIYRFTHIPVASWHTGDVFARAYVRWMEIQNSIVFVREQLQTLPSGPILSPMGPLQPERLAVSLIEGWRGEICHVAITDKRGSFVRYKVVDPSFHNWPALAHALRNQQISDFPLCNKSFNLSYCGHDL
jgi:Ni,Fe-hydrogenase III large subunit/Ni,Fe-hydrogenase III component G